MTIRGVRRKAVAAAAETTRRSDEGVLHDLRFRTLLGAQEWAALPAAVRARFGARLSCGSAVVYLGGVTASRRSLAGAVLAQLCRLIGGPLPLHDEVGAPAVVTVTEDGRSGGQHWTRMYGRARGVPQVIHSSKRFAGPTGLEEYLGFGVGIALTVRADPQALHFRSDHFFLSVAGRRLRLPAWLGPGALSISHVDRGGGSFAFVLALRHPLLGALIEQTAVFHDTATAISKETTP